MPARQKKIQGNAHNIKGWRKRNKQYLEEIGNKKITEEYYQLSQTDKITSDKKLKDPNYNSDILLVSELLTTAGLAETNDSSLKISEDFLKEIEIVTTLIDRS